MTVCEASPVFVQHTVVPASISVVSGSKKKSPIATSVDPVGHAGGWEGGRTVETVVVGGGGAAEVEAAEAEVAEAAAVVAEGAVVAEAEVAEAVEAEGWGWRRRRWRRGPSSLRIVPSPWPSAIVAFEASERLTK